ncbi:MAG: glycosyltransferase family 4 protein [Planctomycetaceae bacterium]
MPTAVIDLTRLKKLHCGLGQFAMHLGRALQSTPPANWLTQYVVPRPAHKRMAAEAPAAQIRTAEWWQREWPRRVLGNALRLDRGYPWGDVWHTIDHLSTYGPRDRQTPVILTIHDLNFPTIRTAAQNRHSLDLLQRRIDRATLLTTGSHFAAEQIRSHLDIGDKELRVIYHGLCVRADRDVPTPRFAPRKPYLFSIGEFRPDKNFHVLIDFLRGLPPPLQLVIAGNHATVYAAEVRSEIARCGLADRVILPGVVDDNEREWLYANCEAFVFPSLAEGFGLPAIEAMSFGKPVFLAEATSLPEVGGPLAFYWNDDSPDAMRDVFLRGQETFRSTPNYADQLRAHAGQFTWTEAAANYWRLYEEVALTATTRCAG